MPTKKKSPVNMPVSFGILFALLAGLGVLMAIAITIGTIIEMSGF